MKLLFDQNLAPRLKTDLRTLFPGSLHVRELGLSASKDMILWNYAKENGLAIVSKDGDFHQKSLFYGHPPKVLWIKRGGKVGLATHV